MAKQNTNDANGQPGSGTESVKTTHTPDVGTFDGQQGGKHQNDGQKRFGR